MLGPLFWYFLKVPQKSTENAVRIVKFLAGYRIETLE
jgi:hypothetical protein